MSDNGKFLLSYSSFCGVAGGRVSCLGIFAESLHGVLSEQNQTWVLDRRWFGVLVLVWFRPPGRSVEILWGSVFST